MLDLHPKIPISIIMLLIDFYTARVYSRSSVYGSTLSLSPLSTLPLSPPKIINIFAIGESGGESATRIEAPPIWGAWKKMLADIFFFFE